MYSVFRVVSYFCFVLVFDFFLCFFDHSRIAQKAMLLAERFDVGAQIPKIFPGFYGLIAWRFEPFHLGADSLRRGFEAGLTYGNSDMGLHCAVHAIKNSIHSGANLRSLLKEIDYYLHVSEKYNSELTKNFILIFRETVSLLIDKGHASSIEAKACFGDVNKKENKFREAVLHHSAIRCFWLGHHERSQHFSEKCMNLDLVEQKGNCTACIVKFYYGKMEGRCSCNDRVILEFIFHDRTGISFQRLPFLI
ncbi:MAG: hypothetical protein RL690_935 [Actinomycetota bacterium]|jgi:hypothetical protein